MRLEEFVISNWMELCKNIEPDLKTNYHITGYYTDTILKYDDNGNPEKYIRTTIEFGNDIETVSCPEEEFNAYNGFCICFAKYMSKKYFKQNISDMVRYWTDIMPRKLKEEQLKKNMQIAEQQRIAERNKKRREKNRIRMEAIKRKEAYEARKLAEEKYGVPVDWNEGKA